MSKLSIRDFAILRLLLSIEGIGPSRLRSLVRTFYKFETILDADLISLVNVEGINQSIAKQILSSKEKLTEFEDKVNSELLSLDKMGSKIISIWDEDYPPILKRIYDAPILLYISGDLIEVDQYCVSVVGTRDPSNYGKINAEKLAAGLSEAGLTIVSGLARGIDTVAHTSVLNSGGRTIAVLGCGIDVFYPPENRKYYDIISRNGALISEFPLKTKPDAINFPQRNRIISGLSLGTLVIESKLNGGALQTAYYALEQNREVFALPGNVGVKQSEGTNSLIKKGHAKLVQSVDDILDELKSKLEPLINKERPKNKVIELNLFQEKILQNLSNEPVHVDKLSTLTGIVTADCLYHLLTLEMEGLVKQLPGAMFVLY